MGRSIGEALALAVAGKPLTGLPAESGSMTGGAGDRDGEAADPVELGVELLAHLEADAVPLADAMDRIETIATDPAVTRAIVDAAAERGIVDREAGVVRPRAGVFVRFDRQVVSKEGEFSCRRCGASLETGYFIRFDAAEHGPFGSSCIRKVTGRD